jgi:DNA-binding NarL/FixJ family response regulator
LKDCGTILIVDSDDASRLTAVQVAVRLGYDARPAPSSDELLERLGPDRPALAIVEVELPGHANGLEVMRQLHDAFGGDLPVILVSAERTDAFDRAAGLMLGADDYLLKPVDSGELLARVKRSLRRSVPLPSNGKGNGNANGSGHANDANLSPREREILALLAEGRTQTQIASSLVISSKTVATHIQRILSKLGVQSRAQAVAVAFQRGLVEPEVRAHALSAEPVPVP